MDDLDVNFKHIDTKLDSESNMVQTYEITFDKKTPLSNAIFALLAVSTKHKELVGNYDLITSIQIINRLEHTNEIIKELVADEKARLESKR